MSFQLPDIRGRPVAVLGGGVLGRRIATTWASGGFNVRIRDPDSSQRSAAIRYWRDNAALYPKILGTNKSPGTVEAFADLEDAIDNAWLVVECVPEKLEIKVSTFAELEKIAPEDAVLASNSSSYKTSEMVKERAEAIRRRVLNMHYQMPPEASLVELMTCGDTAPEIFDFVSEHLRSCGMHPVVAKKESTGFIFNRIWAAIKREVISVIAEGVSDAETIDAIWKKRYGGAYGPCEQMDATGLDTVMVIEEHYIKERGYSGANTVDFLQREFISQGKLGKKSEKGGFFPPWGLPSKDNKEDVPMLYVLDVGVLATANPLHSGRIIAARGDGTGSKPLIEKQAMPDGIDVDNGRLYWSNMGIPSEDDGEVLSCNLDGGDIRSVVPKGHIHTPKQLTLDRQNKKLYVSDREGMRVMRCNYDGSQLETLYQAGDWHDSEQMADMNRHCVGVAVDNQAGYFYWTQKGAPKSSHGRILRASLKKSPLKTSLGLEPPDARRDVETLFEKLPEPIDLELDIENGYLYWTDRGELPLGNSINRVALKDVATGPATEHKHEILVRNMHEAIGLKLDTKNRHMYSTDMGGTVYRFNLDGTDRRKMYDELGAYTGIAVYHGKS